MGNCIGSEAYDESHDHSTSFVNPTSSVLFSSGTPRAYSNGGVMSVSSSSADHSQVSRAVSDTAVPKGEILPTPNLKEYTLAELKSATRNFKRDLILGVGGIGTVFKGWVDEMTSVPSTPSSGMMVAIKKLSKENLQDHQEFLSEVSFLGRLSHTNLVRLLGYCSEDEELLLVYEFAQKRSLDNHLFRRNASTEPLSWDIRLKIAIGAARGLAFLHSSERTIIYRAFKTSNILLDGNYNAKLANFGLAKLGPVGEKSHVTTRIINTDGYAAPEYLATGHLYVKSDVYGFGLVLLEMLTGRRVLDRNRPMREHNLLNWITSQVFEKRKVKLIKSVIDSRIEGQYSSIEAHLAAQITLKCLETEHNKRPAMREIVEVLEQIQSIKKKRP